MGLSSIAIRSNLISVLPSQAQTTRFSASSTSIRAVPAERRIELAVMEEEATEEGSASERNQEADADQSNQSSEEAELAKWKANELFKVTCSLLSVLFLSS